MEASQIQAHRTREHILFLRSLSLPSVRPSQQAVRTTEQVADGQLWLAPALLKQGFCVLSSGACRRQGQ